MTREIKPLIHFEQLEPRILLSGDSLLNIAPYPLQDTILENTSQVVQYTELLDTNEKVEEQISQELAPSDTPNTDVYQPIFTLFVDDDNTNDESSVADLNVENIDPLQVDEEIAVLSNDSNGDIDGLDTEEGYRPSIYNDDNISVEENTSIEIRGPPAGTGEYSNVYSLSTCVTLNGFLESSDIECIGHLKAPDLQELQLFRPWQKGSPGADPCLPTEVFP